MSEHSHSWPLHLHTGFRVEETQSSHSMLWEDEDSFRGIGGLYATEKGTPGAWIVQMEIMGNIKGNEGLRL